MSGRVRKPSERMREIAEAHRRHASPPPVASSSKPKASTASSSSKPKKAKARSISPGTAALDSYLDFGEDAGAASTYDSAPGQLFCICLSTDDTTPMIQCEGCENWCVGSAVCECVADAVSGSTLPASVSTTARPRTSSPTTATSVLRRARVRLSVSRPR